MYELIALYDYWSGKDEAEKIFKQNYTRKNWVNLLFQTKKRKTDENNLKLSLSLGRKYTYTHKRKLSVRIIRMRQLGCKNFIFKSVRINQNEKPREIFWKFCLISFRSIEI